MEPLRVPFEFIRDLSFIVGISQYSFCKIWHQEPRMQSMLAITKL